MANSLVANPMVIDTDITTWRNDATVVAAGYKTGIRVQKIALAVLHGGTSSAGLVAITAPSDSAVLYPPMKVLATQAIDSVLYVDNPTDPKSSLTWRDFAVTGVTATGTVLYLWWTV